MSSSREMKGNVLSVLVCSEGGGESIAEEGVSPRRKVTVAWKSQRLLFTARTRGNLGYLAGSSIMDQSNREVSNDLPLDRPVARIKPAGEASL
jgi:hypothetical protein